MRVVAPASPVAPEVLAAGLAVAAELGLAVEVDPTVYVAPESRRWLAASDEARGAALSHALATSEHVWMARGGYGSGRLVTRTEGLAAAWKGTLWAFSDGTALLARAFAWGKPAWSAPPVSQLPRLDSESKARLVAAMKGGAVAPSTGLEALSGDAGQVVEGRLFAANLAVLASLCGTPLMPDLAGAVLAIEDVNEPPYRLDRFFWQLVSAGALDGVVALVAGTFSGGENDDVHQVLCEVGEQRRIPVWTGLALGHGERNACWPIGRRVRLGHGSLELDDV